MRACLPVPSWYGSGSYWYCIPGVRYGMIASSIWTVPLLALLTPYGAVRYRHNGLVNANPMISITSLGNIMYEITTRVSARHHMYLWSALKFSPYLPSSFSPHLAIRYTDLPLLEHFLSTPYCHNSTGSLSATYLYSPTSIFGSGVIFTQ